MSQGATQVFAKCVVVDRGDVVCLQQGFVEHVPEQPELLVCGHEAPDGRMLQERRPEYEGLCAVAPEGLVLQREHDQIARSQARRGLV